jgi:hypothetical protein
MASFWAEEAKDGRLAIVLEAVCSLVKRNWAPSLAVDAAHFAIRHVRRLKMHCCMSQSAQDTK